MNQLLGLTLDRALAELQALGVHEVRVEHTRAPRRQQDLGELRVVRAARDGKTLWVSAFVTQPAEAQPDGRKG